MVVTLEARLLDKVEYPDGEDGCWLWTGTLINSGYGRVWLEGRTVLAHRAAYELWNGEIPEGMTVDHQCHNESDCALGNACPHRRCINPDHLVVATQRVNLLSGKTLPARNAVKTHCDNGHEFTSDNTTVYKDGRGRSFRHCRQCDRERHRKRTKVRIRVHSR
jgi:hypothetical protein